MTRETKRERERRIVAHHEAGHAVVGHMLGCTVERVAIGYDSGCALIPSGQKDTETDIVVALAGPYAQQRFAPRSDWRERSHTGFKSGCDFDVVTDMIFDLHGKGKVAEAYWCYVEARAEQLVEQHWDRIERLANALLERKRLTGEEMKALFSSTWA